MRLFIPRVGDRIVLTSPWKLDLYYESRNQSLFEALGIPGPRYMSWRETMVDFDNDDRRLRSVRAEVTLGTVLEVDRVYIRANNRNKDKDDSYDSVSFKVVKHPSFPGRVRFWAKLDDVNCIECERVQP